MLKLSSMSPLALAAVLAAAMSSPVAAAALNNNISVGHINTPRPNNFGNTATGASNQIFTPNTPHGPKLKGPVVTDEGGCHTKANSIQRCYP
jgi:hypothetical protein